MYAIKETPAPGKRDSPKLKDEKTSTEKKPSEITASPHSSALGRMKKARSPHFQEMKPNASLTPMKVGRNAQQN